LFALNCKNADLESYLRQSSSAGLGPPNPIRRILSAVISPCPVSGVLRVSCCPAVGLLVGGYFVLSGTSSIWSRWPTLSTQCGLHSASGFS